MSKQPCDVLQASWTSAAHLNRVQRRRAAVRQRCKKWRIAPAVVVRTAINKHQVPQAVAEPTCRQRSSQLLQ